MGAGSEMTRSLEALGSPLDRSAFFISDSSSSLRAFFSRTLKTHVGEPSYGGVVRRCLSLACRTHVNAMRTLALQVFRTVLSSMPQTCV